VIRGKHIADIFAGIDDELAELVERLDLGDDESVWAWFEHHYPKIMGPVRREQFWREWVSAVRDLYECDDTGA
jgi:hypothetical protein